MRSELFHHLIGIFQAFFVIFGAWWGYVYYAGKIKLNEENEERRTIKIKKYGWILKAGIFVCLVSGIVMAIRNLIKIISVIMG